MNLGSLAAAWPATATRYLGLRLRPGDDLRAALEAAFAAEPEQAGFIAAAVGSLSAAHLRFADQAEGEMIGGPLEIVALSGTFSPDGPHLHIAVSDEAGRMAGGHLLAGSPVRTTVELVIGLVTGVTFQRLADPETGFAELSFATAPPPQG